MAFAHVVLEANDFLKTSTITIDIPKTSGTNNGNSGTTEMPIIRIVPAVSGRIFN